MATLSSLPKFEPGQPLEAQLSASRMNSIIDYIRESTPIGPNTNRTAAGTFVEVPPQGFLAGAYDNPYLLGTLGAACSTTTGPGGITGPWGGSMDTPSSVTMPHLDIWERVRSHQLSDIANVLTIGFKLQFITRALIYNSGSGTYEQKLFGREVTFDARGCVQKIDGETIVEYDITTGSGSSGGGI